MDHVPTRYAPVCCYAMLSLPHATTRCRAPPLSGCVCVSASDSIVSESLSICMYNCADMRSGRTIVGIIANSLHATEHDTIPYILYPNHLYRIRIV